VFLSTYSPEQTVGVGPDMGNKILLVSFIATAEKKLDEGRKWLWLKWHL
jgi:hypothetical protein